MKKQIYILTILLLIVGCGRDLEQAQKYSDMKSETANSIKQADLIIKDQKLRYDSVTCY